MLLASVNLIEKISDHPWPGCQVELFGMKATLMSNCIAAMVLAAILLMVILIPLARRRQKVPTGGANVLEVVVLFVRDMIARPALRGQADRFLPFLLTMFCFVLSVNLMGLLPIEPLTAVIPRMPLIGGSATSIPVVCGTLAAITLTTLLVLGLKNQAVLWHEKHDWPIVLCAAISPFLWVGKLAPPVPGLTGVLLMGPLMVLELMSVFAKCLALMIRLFANMFSGHILLAVIMLLVITPLESGIRLGMLLVLGPLAVLAGVVQCVMELLIAGLQAYIFTFLSAIFIGLYTEPGH